MQNLNKQHCECTYNMEYYVFESAENSSTFRLRAERASGTEECSRVLELFEMTAHYGARIHFEAKKIDTKGVTETIIGNFWDKLRPDDAIKKLQDFQEKRT